MNKSTIAFQKDGVTEVEVPLSFSIFHLFGWLIDSGKILMKYFLIFWYIWVVYCKVRAYMKGRKLKSV